MYRYRADTVIKTNIYVHMSRSQNWTEAVSWYNKALSTEAGTEDIDTDVVYSSSIQQQDPDHVILSRMAELYRSGGPGLDKDPQRSGELYSEAAEAAMNAMKGKLANKFYMLAEEVWAEVPDDEESGE